MAKNMDDVFADIMNDCEAIARDAVKFAAKKIQADVMKEAKKYLKKYYANYSPEWYQRTYRLHRAILPYWSDKSTKDAISIEVGVRYKSSALKGAYQSYSWRHQSGDVWISRKEPGFNFDSWDNGIPEPSWILENYLEGQHGGAHQDAVSPTNLMENFLNTKAQNRIGQYLSQGLSKAISSRL